MITVGSYLLKWCPIANSLLEQANWIDFISRFNHNFKSAEYFVETFPLLNFVDDKLQLQLLEGCLCYKTILN